MTSKGGANNLVTKIFLPIFWIFGLIIFGISIAGIAKTQDRVPRDFFIVILSFIIFIGLISFIQFAYQRNTQSLYDVQAGGDLEKGSKDNKAFESVERTNVTTTNQSKEPTGEKWVNNYVPYGEYPKGSDAKKQEMANQNGISGISVAVLEVDSTENRDEKHDKEKEDSNKHDEE